MASAEQRIHQFTRRKIKRKLKGNKGRLKENKGKLKEKKGKLMENKRKWTGNKGQLKGNVFKFLIFFENLQKSRKMQFLNWEFINLQEGKLKEN